VSDAAMQVVSAGSNASPRRRSRARLFAVPKDRPIAPLWPAPAVGGRLKRAFDIVTAASLLVLLAPLFLMVMAAMALFDRGPAFYGHTRIGLGGRRFKCLKFRSMIVDSDAALNELLARCPVSAKEWADTRKLRNDPRVTFIGKFLRKSSIDELPQLINVLKGEMSLVGPRPVTQDELVRYDLARVHYLRARPGLTGLWQVSGRSNTSYKRRVEFDKAYAINWSFWSDISIMLRTVPALLSSSGAM
jgi:exopolysaccharide production protein ExoY